MGKYCKNHTVYTRINIRTKISKQFMLCVVQNPQCKLPFVMFPQVQALLEVW